MPIAKSKLTAQCQISVPAEIRRRLGLQPGSVIEWDADGDGRVVARKAGGAAFEDIHKALFPEGPPPYKTDRELKDGIRQYVLDRHARGRY